MGTMIATQPADASKYDYNAIHALLAVWLKSVVTDKSVYDEGTEPRVVSKNIISHLLDLPYYGASDRPALEGSLAEVVFDLTIELVHIVGCSPLTDPTRDIIAAIHDARWEIAKWRKIAAKEDEVYLAHRTEGTAHKCVENP